MEPWFGDREQLEGNTVTWWLGLQAFVQVTAFVSRYPNSPGDSDTRCGLWGCLEPRVAPQKVIGVLKTGTPQSTSPPPWEATARRRQPGRRPRRTLELLEPRPWTTCCLTGCSTVLPGSALFCFIVRKWLLWLQTTHSHPVTNRTGRKVRQQEPFCLLDVDLKPTPAQRETGFRRSP